MCGEQTGTGRARTFDPTRCPLLQGLTHDEVERMMRTDPRIRACVAAVESGKPDLAPCPTETTLGRDPYGSSSRVA